MPKLVYVLVNGHITSHVSFLDKPIIDRPLGVLCDSIDITQDEAEMWNFDQLEKKYPNTNRLLPKE